MNEQKALISDKFFRRGVILSLVLIVFGIYQVVSGNSRSSFVSSRLKPDICADAKDIKIRVGEVKRILVRSHCKTGKIKPELGRVWTLSPSKGISYYFCKDRFCSEKPISTRKQHGNVKATSFRLMGIDGFVRITVSR